MFDFYKTFDDIRCESSYIFIVYYFNYHMLNVRSYNPTWGSVVFLLHRKLLKEVEVYETWTTCL